MAAIIGVIREHRVSVILTGSITLIMFLSIIFAAKENKALNFSLLTLLAIAVQSLIFSEMLKERHAASNRRSIGYLATMSRNIRNVNNAAAATSNPNLAAVVVYQSNRDRSNNLFMIDPTFTSELPKDPPPSYFSTATCPPPKYEDAIKVNASEQSLPVVPGASNNNNNSDQTPPPPPASFDEGSIASTSVQSNVTQANTPNTCNNGEASTSKNDSIEHTQADSASQPTSEVSTPSPPPTTPTTTTTTTLDAGDNNNENLK